MKRIAGWLLTAFFLAAPSGAEQMTTEHKWALIEALQSPDAITRSSAADELIAAADSSVAAPLVELIFFSRDARVEAQRVLAAILAIEPEERSVHPYQFWLAEVGRHENISPIPGYLDFKARLYSRIDPAFGEFLQSSHPRRIRPEEIVFGGVAKDGIPALDQPKVVLPAEAGWLEEEELVFGLFVNGEARAYPRRVLDWHEMANDTVGGVPISLAWCTLCGSAIAYRGELGDRTFTFGSSGLLYRSNKLMYDRQTNTLWSQLAGEPVMGPLASEEIALERLPIIVTRWSDWKAVHPDTTVVSRETGYNRDYDRPPYTDYFASERLMFPVWQRDDRLEAKTWVWTTTLAGSSRAWAVDALRQTPILHDRVGETAVVLLTNPRSGGVRMYASADDVVFVKIDSGALVTADGRRFTITEDALEEREGLRLERIVGHEAFWFAWSAEHPDTTLWSEEAK